VPEGLSDPVLVARASKGDEAAFVVLYERHRDAAGEHRAFFDTGSGLYYGYDIRLTKNAAPPGFLVSLGPFSAERVLREMWPGLCPGCPDARPVSSAQQRFPAPQVVAPGDRIVVDLLTDERSGEVVSEEITVVSKDAPPPESTPQDFRAEEVAFQVNGVQLRIAGGTVPQRAVGSVRGPVIWLQLPGHGRAFFSLVPPGYAFEKTGVVAGNKLRVASPALATNGPPRAPSSRPVTAPRPGTSGSSTIPISSPPQPVPSTWVEASTTG